jgi:hypothetical protein
MDSQITDSVSCLRTANSGSISPAPRCDDGRHLRHAVVFLGSLGVLEYLLFSESFSQFFQGDALFWLLHRFRGWADFTGSLPALDVANWYRPLSNRTIPAIFFGWFGLNPYGYHWVVFILFFVCTCLVFQFIRHVTSSFRAAAWGSVFFSLHSNNVYVTYDFAFAPELFYASFYLLSSIAFLKSFRSLKWRLISILCFILALMSKEAAATLPGNLFLLHILIAMPDEIAGARSGIGELFRRVRSSLICTMPFFGVLLVYYLYVVRHLKVGSGDYAFSIHAGVLPRLMDSLFWAFNFAGGRPDPMRTLSAAIFYPLLGSVVLLAACALSSLLGRQRRQVWLGAGWFFLAMTPMLGIVGHFAAYYLFLPMVGVAIVVGLCLDGIYRSLNRVDYRLATAAVSVLLLPSVIAARENARYDLHHNSALGFSGRIAETSSQKMKELVPSLPAGATVYILNSNQPDLWRYYGLDALSRLTYADDSIEVLYSSLGHTVSDELLKSEKLIVMMYENESLLDVTAEFRENPLDFISFPSELDYRYASSDELQLTASPTYVAAGKDSYTLRISGAEGREVEVQYRFNEGPLAFLTLHLNPRGETKFFVSQATKRGRYRFTGFRLLPETVWFRADGTVTVTD